MNVRFVSLALTDFPGARAAGEHRKAQFKAGWGKTLEKLDSELSRIDAHGVIVQAGFRSDQIRLDGWPYGNAVPLHPAVILSFRDGRNNALSFPCDTFLTIDDNLRAIALSLEALRAVDRFGVTRRNEQYMGFKAIEAPRSMTVEAALEFMSFIASQSGLYAGAWPMQDADDYRKKYRALAAFLHPDRGGDPGLWHKLGEAKEVLDAHFGLRTEQGAR